MIRGTPSHLRNGQLVAYGRSGYHYIRISLSGQSPFFCLGLFVGRGCDRSLGLILFRFFLLSSCFLCEVPAPRSLPGLVLVLILVLYLVLYRVLVLVSCESWSRYLESWSWVLVSWGLSLACLLLPCLSLFAFCVNFLRCLSLIVSGLGFALSGHTFVLGCNLSTYVCLFMHLRRHNCCLTLDCLVLFFCLSLSSSFSFHLTPLFCL